MSSLQEKVEKLIKYGNDKFGLSETTLRGILDNASSGGGELCNVSVMVTGEIRNAVTNYTVTANKGTTQTFNIELDDYDVTSFLVNDVTFTNYTNDLSNIVFNLDITGDINVVIEVVPHEAGFG